MVNASEAKSPALAQIVLGPSRENLVSLLEGVYGLTDPMLWGHSLRVGKMARKVAEALALDTVEVERLELAGFIHDIGRIGETPRDRSAGGSPRLPGEYVHCVRGAKVIADAPWLSKLLPAVLFHHERWDGSGFPAGLRGEAIPLDARIVALVDSFDRMTSGYFGDTPMPVSEAMAYIRANRDILFDPTTVDAFLAACVDSLTVRELRGRPHLDLIP